MDLEEFKIQEQFNMLSAEKIQSNWNRYINEITDSFSKERTDILLPFLDKYKERMMMMPASSKNWHHSAFAGGYTDNILNCSCILNSSRSIITTM